MTHPSLPFRVVIGVSGACNEIREVLTLLRAVG